MQSLSIAELLPAAAAIALNPPAVVAVILMLSSATSRKSAFWFAGGWLAGLLAVGAVVLLLGDASGVLSGSSRIGLIVKLALGLLLLVVAVRQWRRRPSSAGAEAEMPGWMRTLTASSPRKALVTGALFAALNPKTLALNVAGVIVIAEAQLSAVAEMLALLVFVLVASLTVVAPVVYSAVAPVHSEHALDATQQWLMAHNKAITATVLLILGIMLISSGVQGLVAA